MPERYVEIESFKFTDIVRHWARERLVHEVIVARELAHGVLKEGLRLNSGDPQWLKPSTEFRGAPLVGYAARRQQPPIVIRAAALAHLRAVAAGTVDADPLLLADEVVTKNDFRTWLVMTGRAYPAFWFGPEERGEEHP